MCRWFDPLSCWWFDPLVVVVLCRWFDPPVVVLLLLCRWFDSLSRLAFFVPSQVRRLGLSRALISHLFPRLLSRYRRGR